jgi:hypothetical protein
VEGKEAGQIWRMSLLSPDELEATQTSRILRSQRESFCFNVESYCVKHWSNQKRRQRSRKPARSYIVMRASSNPCPIPSWSKGHLMIAASRKIQHSAVHPGTSKL